jgi:hypothetical protein
MEKKKQTRRLLLEQQERYPQWEICDLFKFLFQSSLGCEHMVSDPAIALARLQSEWASCEQAKAWDAIEELDGAYVRVHLGVLRERWKIEPLLDAFVQSTACKGEGIAALQERLAVARAMIDEGSLSFSPDDFDRAAAEWEALGYPALHHSSTYRETYRPAYRVISRSLLPKN